ncbi:MAG: biotin--[acetyl-CoA-carboxylase] ligase [Bdellovibrionota bacterium]
MHFDLLHFKSCDSTQDCALEYSLKNNCSSLIICDNQKQGRGRRGRQWKSSTQSSLTMSLSFHKNIISSDPALLSLYAGAVLYILLSEQSSKLNMLSLKWPNDLGVFTETSFKKVAGILVELKKDYFLVGIGINLQAPAPWPEAISLEELDSRPYNIDKKDFARSFGAMFLNYLNSATFSADELLEFLNNKAMSALWNKDLGANWKNHRAKGLAGDGALITLGPNSKLQTIYSGDIL